MADRKLVVRVGSTVELPFEPDPGSCGSSSCVSIFSRYTSVSTALVVLKERVIFHAATVGLRPKLRP